MENFSGRGSNGEISRAEALISLLARLSEVWALQPHIFVSKVITEICMTTLGAPRTKS